MKKKSKILIPSYADGFRCVGGSCEDSCCIGWDIDIDRKTYRKYRSAKNRTMKMMFKKHIYRNDQSYSPDLDYGKIAIEESKKCPFLDTDRYCAIQKNMGEEYLSNVCFSFPRVYNILDGLFEYSLYMSCPEAVRKLLACREPIQFTEKPMDHTRYVVNSSIHTREKCWRNTPLAELPELRSLAIKILQDRSKSIDRRLLELGERLALRDLRRDEAPAGFAGGAGRTAFRMDIMQYAIESLGLIGRDDSPVFADYTERVMFSFGLSGDESHREKAGLYEDVLESIAGPFKEDNSFVYEHYLVNTVFQENFPFSQNLNAFDGYIMLVIRYALFHFYLIGVGAAEGKIGLGDAARLIQVHTKILNHHKTFAPNLLMEIRRRCFDNMEAMSLLLDLS